MSAGLNRVMLIGNLAADAELRSTQGGTSVLKFRMGCTESYTTRDGEKKETTEWVSLVLWGKLGESVHRYMTKGKQVFVEGKLQTSSWEDEDGTKRYRTEVNVSTLRLLGGGGGGGERQERRPAPAPAAAEPADEFPVEDDDLPF